MKRSVVAIGSGATIIGVIIVILSMEYGISNVSSGATIIGVVVAISALGLSYWKFLQDKDAEKKRASKNLHTELADALRGLDEERFPDSQLCIKIKEDGEENDESVRTLYFMNRILNHDFYDSLVFSGKINSLEPEFQQPIQDIFRRIKTHNEYLTRIDHMIERQGDGIAPKSAYRYFKWMDKNEPELKETIRSIMKKLEKEL